jgi:ABC-2 type transport system permease protein
MSLSTVDPGRSPSLEALLWRQTRHHNRLMWRTPIATFFAIFFPLLFLVLLSVINGNETVDSRGGIRFAQFFTPGIVVFGIISSTYTNLATTLPIDRDQGILKRVLGTPLPAPAYIGGRILSASWFALIGTVVMISVAVLAFDVQLFLRTLPALAFTIVLGALSMCALGLAVGSLAPTADSGPALANLTFLPVAFISDIFVPMDDAPGWLQFVGWIFPVKHFARAVQTCFDPATTGWGFEWGHLAVIALWGLAGAVVARRRFSWEPKGAPRAPRRRRG